MAKIRRYYDKVDNPVKLYESTKKSRELITHAYSKLFNISSASLGFFTVYLTTGSFEMALKFEKYYVHFIDRFI